MSSENQPKKPALKKTAKTYSGTLLCLMTLTFDLLIPKYLGFQDSS